MTAEVQRNESVVALSVGLLGALLAVCLVFLRASELIFALGALLAAFSFSRIYHRPEFGVCLFVLTYPLTSLFPDQQVIALSIPNILLLITSFMLLLKVIGNRQILRDVGPVIQYSYYLIPIFLVTIVPGILI